MIVPLIDQDFHKHDRLIPRLDHAVVPRTIHEASLDCARIDRRIE